MHVLIGIALKSLVLAGITLGLLALMKKRSAAERSWVAHIGLLALVIMAFAPLVLPSWKVETPSLFAQAPTEDSAVKASAPAPTKVAPTIAPKGAENADLTPPATISAAGIATAAYAVPAAILLLITLLALGRLIALRARADVLVDGHWLSALARAQRRMGFKHGTALLTSDDLASPISWGVVRPVILLNKRAVEASNEAEAIIAHELAHVARMDWAKLLLARIATALFWFNPLVWMLAREAHQLREETADDAVLAADIDDTDYAQLLVGVARHECPGLLLGAHGVAPSKSSLARRVARVLDGTSVRSPVARSFALGVFTGAVLIAAPLAALTLTPASEGPKKAAEKKAIAGNFDTSKPYYGESDVPTDLASIIASGVSTSVSSAVAAVAPVHLVSSDGSSVDSANGGTVIRGKDGATVTVYPADSQGRRKMVARSANGATAVTYVDADHLPGPVAMAEGHGRKGPGFLTPDYSNSTGVTPEYIGAMRAAVPRLGNLDPSDFAGLRAVGVTPEYARDLVAAFPSLNAEQLTEARAIGLSGSYVRAMRAAGVNGSFDDFVELRAVGADPEFAERARRSGVKIRNADDLVELRTLGDVRGPAPPAPPAPPKPSNRRGKPAASPPDWDPDPDGG
jgi:bla regulator protein blaR1